MRKVAAAAAFARQGGVKWYRARATSDSDALWANAGDEITTAAFFCDACGKRIEGSGNALWNPEAVDRTVYFAHKGPRDCTRRMDAAFGTRLSWEEMRVFASYLRNSIGNALKEVAVKS